MWVYFNVDFRFSPAEVVKAVQDAISSAPIEGVGLDPPPNCICYDFAREHKDSFAYYAVRYWLTDLARDDPTSSRVRERIWTALRRANIPLAIPGAHLWIERDGEGHKARKHTREIEARIEALTHATFLTPLHDEERATMARNLKYAPFAPGECVTKQGAIAHWFYVIISGSVEVRVDVDDHEKVVARIDAPGFFGEMGLMTGEPRIATVVALTEVECYRVDKGDFHRVLKERPEIANEISTLLAQRRIELLAARSDLDKEAKQRRIDAEKERIFDKVQSFFGLGK
jgi:CRP-like cAMP-binding protein